MSTSARQLTAPRLVLLVVVVGVIVLTLVLARPSHAHPAACPAASFGAAPSTIASAPSTTLPPSQDNDAGRSRIPDNTPDADNDARRSGRTCAPR